MKSRNITKYIKLSQEMHTGMQTYEKNKESAEAYTRIFPHFTWLTLYFPRCIYI